MAKNLKWYQKHFLWRRLRINRRYKDRLFRFLFRDKKDLLELYNAINGSAYSNADDLEIVTLEDAIFMKMKNESAQSLRASKHLLAEHAFAGPFILFPAVRGDCSTA